MGIEAGEQVVILAVVAGGLPARLRDEVAPPTRAVWAMLTRGTVRHGGTRHRRRSSVMERLVSRGGEVADTEPAVDTPNRRCSGELAD